MGQKQLQIELGGGFNIKHRTRDFTVLTGCTRPSLVLELQRSTADYDDKFRRQRPDRRSVPSKCFARHADL